MIHEQITLFPFCIILFFNLDNKKRSKWFLNDDWPDIKILRNEIFNPFHDNETMNLLTK